MTRFPVKFLSAIAIATLAIGLAWAQLATPPLTGRVVDNAGLLDAAQENVLTDRLAAHEASTGEQVVVVTLPSLEGDVLEDVSLRLARDWGIGQADFDNGALLLVAQAERQIRIEVGYGLEGRLTDIQSGLIIRETMVPRFRTGDFAGGISAGVDAVLGVLGGTRLNPAPSVSFDEVGIDPGSLIFFLLFGLFFVGPSIASLFRPPLTQEQKKKQRRRRRGRGWLIGGAGLGGRGGGFGGGGFSGGGGGFGGGGASGGW